LLVIATALSYFIIGSASILFGRIGTYRMTSARVLVGALIEALLLTLVLAILQIRGWDLERLGLRFSTLAVLSGIPLFIAYIVLYWATALTIASAFPKVASVHAFKFVMAAHPAAMLVFIVINSFFEEIIVTGYVVTALARDGAAVAVSASTFLRFLYHLYQGPLASISILPLGLLFGVVYWRWRNLWPLIVAHSITNILAFVVYG
jgi:membrane protease YdiL (CAAX protease family)